MDDQQLREVLRSLPRQDAPEGFTRATVQRLGARGPRGRTWRRLALVAAVCAGLIGLGVPLALSLSERAGREQVRDELERLKQDHDALEAQLAALRASEKEPELLYLGGTDSADYVLDLRQLARPPDETRPDRTKEPGAQM